MASLALLLTAACRDDPAESDSAPAPTTIAPAGTPSAADAPSLPATSTATTGPPVAPAPTIAPTTISTTPTASTASTTAPGVAGLGADAHQVLEIGRSVEGRPILAVERGTPGGVVVLVIGVIHGDEDAGVAILERLATASVPEGVDLWLIETMNPDGQARDQRGNANGVDLNRNFPYRWGPIGEPGDPQYAGTGPASEPETRAVVDFVSDIRPALGLWYHQDLFRLTPGEGFEGELKRHYAELTGLPIEPITGGTYTGIAATWQRTTVEGVSFIVELGPKLSDEEAERHAAAVLQLAAMVADR